MKPLKLLLRISCLGLVILLLVACGASSVSMVPTPTATPTPSETPTATSESAPAAAQWETTATVTDGDIGEVPRIWPEVLIERLDNGEKILVVDTRPLTFFEREHIVGAISVPLDEVESRLDELPRDQEIVLYCT